MNLVLRWWRERQRRRRQAAWLRSVLDGTHVHTEQCGSYLAPPCTQAQLFHTELPRIIKIDKPLTQVEADRLKVEWRKLTR